MAGFCGEEIALSTLLTPLACQPILLPLIRYSRYIKKSGKQTFGVAKFWSGTVGRSLRGLEIGCLAFVGVSGHTALHGLAEQSPGPDSLHGKGKTLVDHYVKVIVEHAAQIKALTSYVVVDGYFMKKDFIQPLLLEGLHLITKARSDANLQYVYIRGSKKSRDAEGCLMERLMLVRWIKET